MNGKVAFYFRAAVTETPTSSPAFVDRNRYYGTILHKVPTEVSNEGSPLGIFHSFWRWASPFVENLAIDQVLQNTKDFADRFASVIGGSGDQSTYASMFESVTGTFPETMNVV